MISNRIIRLISESARTMTVYHGSNALFKKFEQTKARILNDYYGGGVAYFTGDKNVAVTYASAMKRKYGGEKYVYEVELNLSKIFDVDHVFKGKELTQFFSDADADDFARGSGLLKVGVDKYSVMAKLKSGDIELTGEQVFKGLSRGMVNTAKARQKLISLGFDGLRYNGGVNMGMATKHDVYLAYNADDVRVKKVYKVKS
jgi:hypothetical protein